MSVQYILGTYVHSYSHAGFWFDKSVRIFKCTDVVSMVSVVYWVK